MISQGHAAVANGSKRIRRRVTRRDARSLLPKIDGRSVWARVLRESYRGVITHCGGDDAISELERFAARRVADLLCGHNVSG
jgi:hypothetical protein